MDLLKKGDDWHVIEVNTEPALDFFPEETSFLMDNIIDFIIKTDAIFKENKIQKLEPLVRKI